MLAAILHATLTLTTFGPCGDEPSETESERPLVLQLHSLSGLVDWHGFDDGSLSLLPYQVMTSQMRPESNATEGPAPLAAEDVVTFVREMIDPGTWDELPGASIDVKDGDRLLVVAPQETQDAIAEFLARLEAAIVPTEMLEVRVVPLKDGDVEGDFAGETTIETAEADRRNGERRTARFTSVALRGRAVVEAADVDRETIIYDYEVEIAQGATIADPIVDGIATGLEVVARSTRVDGGTLVNVLVRASEPTGPTTERRVAAKSLVNAKPVMSERFAAGIFEHPQLRFASFAGAVFLPDGKAAWIPVSVQTHQGPVAFCLDLRVTGRLSPFRSSIEPPRQSPQESMRFDLVSRGAADLGRIQIPRIRRNLFDEQWTTEGSEPIWAILNGPEDDGLLVDLVARVASEVLESGHGSVGYAGGYVRTWLPRPFGDRVATALAPLQRFEAATNVRGRILVGGKERGRFRLPVVLGRPLALWSGIQGTRLVDWDVDVANEAQSCNPQPEAWMDGIALRLEVSRNAASELLVHANAKLELLTSPPIPVDLMDESRLTIDKIRARTLWIDELRTLPVQGGKVLFGGDVALELEVTSALR